MTHRIMLMADTHGRTDFAVEPTGLVIHAGDLTRLGDLDELEEQAKWLAWIPAERVVVIAGNHDLCFEKTPEEARAILDRYRITYLEDAGAEVLGYKIWGSPWSLECGYWAFMGDEAALAEKYAMIPDDIDILIAHGPPKGIGDRVWSGESVGSVALADAIARVKPRLTVHGHIHEDIGVRRHPHGGLCVNASCGIFRASRLDPRKLQRGAPVQLKEGWEESR